MSGLPLVSIVIPARNEAASIGSCLAAVSGQTYPHDRMEVLVVDGSSSDETAFVASKALENTGYSRSAVLANVKANTPAGLSAGLHAARGEYIVRIDARAIVPPDYVTKVVETLASRSEIVVVGGAQVACAADGAPVVASAIARSLRNPYATGFAAYRRRRSAGPGDTVYLGAFRKQEVLDAGGWDERFHTNQDYELNRRMARRGIVWFRDDLRVLYRPRTTLLELAAQYRRFGRWKAATWLEAPGSAMSSRHVALLLTPVASALLWAKLGRRRPGVTLSAASFALVALDTAVDEPASIGERALSMVSTCISTSSWLWGIAEQTLRWVGGRRMLRPG